MAECTPLEEASLHELATCLTAEHFGLPLGELWPVSAVWKPMPWSKHVWSDHYQGVKAAEDKETMLWCGKGTYSHQWHDGESAVVWLTAPQRVSTDSCSKTEKCCTLWGSPSFSLQLRKLWLNRWHFNMPLSAMSCCHHHKWMLPLSIESNHFLHRKHCILIPAHTRTVLALSKWILGHIYKTGGRKKERDKAR